MAVPHFADGVDIDVPATSPPVPNWMAFLVVSVSYIDCYCIVDYVGWRLNNGCHNCHAFDDYVRYD